MQAVCLYESLLRSLSEGEGEAWNSRRKEMGSLYFSFQLKQRSSVTTHTLTLSSFLLILTVYYTIVSWL